MTKSTINIEFKIDLNKIIFKFWINLLSKMRIFEIKLSVKKIKNRNLNVKFFIVDQADYIRNDKD